MKAKTLLFGGLVLAVLALLISVAPSRATVESFAQTLVNDIYAGPSTEGQAVLQVNTVNKATSLTATSLTQLIAAPASGSIYVDGIVLEKATATTGYVELEYGTGTNCGTGTAAIVTLGPQTATSLLPLGYYPLHIQVPATKALCGIVDGAGTAALVLAQ